MSIITLILASLVALEFLLYPVFGDHRDDFCSDSSGFSMSQEELGQQSVITLSKTKEYTTV